MLDTAQGDCWGPSQEGLQVYERDWRTHGGIGGAVSEPKSAGEQGCLCYGRNSLIKNIKTKRFSAPKLYAMQRVGLMSMRADLEMKAKGF